MTDSPDGLTLASPADRNIIGVSLNPADLPAGADGSAGVGSNLTPEIVVNGYRIPYSQHRVRTDAATGRQYLENPLGYAEDGEFMTVIEGRVYLDQASISTPKAASTLIPIGLRGSFPVYLASGVVAQKGSYVVPGAEGKAVLAAPGQGYRVTKVNLANGTVTILFPDEGVGVA